MKKIIITGASGFIGRELQHFLVKKDYEVKAYSSKNGDISLEKTWQKMEKVNVVIHLAGMTSVSDSWLNCQEFLRVNSLSLINAINYCIKNNSRLIFLSSFIYDIKNKNPIDEYAIKNPQNPYALSKKIGEEILEFYKKVDNLDVIILRPFNVFGFGQKKNFLIPTIIDQIMQKDKITVMDIKPRRDYIFVRDLVKAVEKTINYDGEYSVFNIGSGKSYSVSEVIEEIQKILNTNLFVECSRKPRKMEINETIADISLAKKELDWKPEYDFRSALKEIIDLYHKK